jgi:hypothetical protein
MPTYLPTTGLVAMAWCKTIFGNIVASSLPAPDANGVLGWQGSGFVQVTELSGGGREVTVDGVRRPVVTVDFWYAPPRGSTKPPWGEAAQLAERLRVATEDYVGIGQPLTMPPNYGGARVLGAWLITEPSRVTDDPAGYARFTADLALDWVRHP